MNEYTIRVRTNSDHPIERGRLQVDDGRTAVPPRHVQVRTLLDIGTGSALFAEAFPDRPGSPSAGVDISQRDDRCREETCADGSEVPRSPRRGIFPLPTASFDSTFFGVVFHEVSDSAKGAARGAPRCPLLHLHTWSGSTNTKSSVRRSSTD
jgi:hypothetical protein